MAAANAAAAPACIPSTRAVTIAAVGSAVVKRTPWASISSAMSATSSADVPKPIASAITWNSAARSAGTGKFSPGTFAMSKAHGREQPGDNAQLLASGRIDGLQPQNAHLNALHASGRICQGVSVQDHYCSVHSTRGQARCTDDLITDSGDR